MGKTTDNKLAVCFYKASTDHYLTLTERLNGGAGLPLLWCKCESGFEVRFASNPLQLSPLQSDFAQIERLFKKNSTSCSNPNGMERIRMNCIAREVVVDNIQL